MSRSKSTFFIGICLLLICIIIAGCLPNKQGGFTCICAPLIKKAQSMLPGIKKDSTSSSSASTTQSTGPTRPHPPVRTGTIVTGAKTQLASQSVPAEGGTIAIDKPGDPLDGFIIDVQAGSYAEGKTFTVSSAPIDSQSFGDDINPISPMITIDNGGDYSEEPMIVRVPVKVPDDSFAMGFIYDQESQMLEGLPLVGKDSESVTLATSHFSSVFVSMIKKALLQNDIDSGFRPGIDDWQFPNEGSIVAKKGHCEGQSNTAMWYYCTQPDGPDACLYGRYDNNGNSPATPELWEDDSLAYRFCSMVHKEKNYSLKFWYNLAGIDWVKQNNTWVRKDVAGIGDENTFNLFSYSIRATGEPQLVWIRTKTDIGHAMIVYKIVGNALYIADPNYRGNTDRKIIYYSGESSFKPYNSGANRKAIEQGKGLSFDTIAYAGKTAVFPWDVIAKRWTEFKAGTIGNGEDAFLPYEIVVDEGADKKVPLDGYKASQKKIKISIDYGKYQYSFRGGLVIFRDGKQVASFLNQGEDDGEIELFPGTNNIGIQVKAQSYGEWYYNDFKYYTVELEDGDCKTPPPANIMDKLHQTTTFHAELLNLPTDIEGHGSLNRWVPGFKFTKHFYVPGNAVSLGGDGSMPISWSGTSFSGGGSADYPDKLTGSVCYGGGKVLVSFDYVSNNPVDNLVFSVKNVPVDTTYFMDPQYAVEGKSQLQYTNTDAAEVKKYVTRLEWKSHEVRTLYGGETQVWDATLLSADWSNKCGFLVNFK